MKVIRILPLAVGLLVGVILTVLKAMHFHTDSLWLAATVGGISGGAVYWIGPKLTRRGSMRDHGGLI